MADGTPAGVWHFSFTVADIERSVAFYRDLLGFELVHRQEQANAYTSRLVGYSDAHLKVAQFRVPGQPRGRSSHDLELVEYVHPTGRRSEPEIRNPGEAHLAVVVDDIDAWHRRLADAGVTFVSTPNRISAGVNAGGATCYFRDPDDIVLELVQPPPAARAPQVHAQVIRLRPEAEAEYRRLHADVWPAVLDRIARSGIRDYSIHLHDGLLFARFTYVGDDFEADMAAMAADPATQRWWELCKPLQEPLANRSDGEWWAEMEPVFHFDGEEPT